MSRASTRYQHDPGGADQAAELGLAQAVLAWRQASSQGFDRAARSAIDAYLQRTHGRATRRRHQSNLLPEQRTDEQPVDD
jgi:hypothetical protein